jgi:peptidoglycan/LPS O-acetylase OafA/YrhL
LNPNWVYWSLSLEEQFYFLFPFFLLLVPIAWRWRVLLIAIAIQFPLSRSSTSFWWHMRLDALMWGVVIYLFSRTKAYRVFEPTSMVNKPLALVANLVLMGGLVVVPSLLKPLPFHVGLMAIISAILVLMASFGRGYAFPIGPIKPTMLWLGSRSYALYLCHIPAFFITGELWLRWTKASGLPPPSWGYTMKFVVTATILSIIFAELNYRLIETPFREKGAKIARRMTTPTVA